jgi:hypothetical protein
MVALVAKNCTNMLAISQYLWIQDTSQFLSDCRFYDPRIFKDSNRFQLIPSPERLKPRQKPWFSRLLNYMSIIFPIVPSYVQQSSTISGWWYTYPSEKYESQLE